jgi:mono/diheme cytochrome c family protein
MMNIKKALLILAAVAAAVFLLIQLVPYGRAHDNPPVVAEPNWDSLQTRELAERACFDCHSNETVWPWYASVAPISWLVQRDVVEGREHLNFSDWNQSHDEHGHEGHEPEEMGETVLEGEMPPAQYLLNHPEARLTDEERAALAAGLAATVELSPTAGAGQAEEHEGDAHTEEGEHVEDEHAEEEGE